MLVIHPLSYLLPSISQSPLHLCSTLSQHAAHANNMTWHLLLGSLLSAGSVVSALVAQPELVGLADIALRDASSVPAGQVTTTINIGTGVVGSPQSTTPTTTTTTPTTTATPTPTGTPHITLDVGSNSVL